MLNVYKQHFLNTFPNSCYDPKIWFVITSALGNVSNDILNQNNSNIEYNIMVLLYIVIKLASVFDVDLDEQWKLWKKKAYKKKYYRGIQSSS